MLDMVFVLPFSLYHWEPPHLFRSVWILFCFLIAVSFDQFFLKAQVEVLQYIVLLWGLILILYMILEVLLVKWLFSSLYSVFLFLFISCPNQVASLRKKSNFLSLALYMAAWILSSTVFSLSGVFSSILVTISIQSNHRAFDNSILGLFLHEKFSGRRLDSRMLF